MPKSEREAVEQENEICGFLDQSHISPKNLARLRTLVSSPISRVAELATLVIDVAEVSPYGRRRRKLLARERRNLLDALEVRGLIDEEFR